jgi:hypothetical protein
MRRGERISGVARKKREMTRKREVDFYNKGAKPEVCRTGRKDVEIGQMAIAGVDCRPNKGLSV